MATTKIILNIDQNWYSLVEDSVTIKTRINIINLVPYIINATDPFLIATGCF